MQNDKDQRASDPQELGVASIATQGSGGSFPRSSAPTTISGSATTDATARAASRPRNM